MDCCIKVTFIKSPSSQRLKSNKNTKLPLGTSFKYMSLNFCPHILPCSTPVTSVSSAIQMQEIPSFGYIPCILLCSHAHSIIHSILQFLTNCTLTFFKNFNLIEITNCFSPIQSHHDSLQRNADISLCLEFSLYHSIFSLAVDNTILPLNERTTPGILL